MRTIHLKLLRDLSRLKGQISAIVVVIAAGIMMLVLAVTTLDTLSRSQGRFYDSHRFAEIFAELKRAPEDEAARLREITGVDQVETRVRAPLRLEVPGFTEPIRGLALSIPDGRQPGLNRLYLRQGALPAADRTDHTLVSEPFAIAHGLGPGDRLTAIINGRLEVLTISGVALSPEFIYQVGPADILPDYQRFAILWMSRRALDRAMDLDGAFNSLLVSLQAGTDPIPVIAALDRRLARYGGSGAVARADQTSHRFLTEELKQLRVMAIVLPAIFLAVAAFLLNLLMGRIIQTQRQQMAVLKAFGYTNAQLALHYGLLTGLIVGTGATLGIGLGLWSAERLAGVYAEYYRLPELSLRLHPAAIALALLIATAAAALGTWRAIRQGVRRPPAEAMRPPTPERFQASGLEHSRLGRRLAQPTRIILRNLGRHRAKATLSVIGIALSGALLLLGSYQFGAVDQLLDLQYRLIMRMDLQLSFTEPTSERALAELRAWPGVVHVEGYRSVPARLIHDHRDERVNILGLEPRPRLRGLLDAERRSLRPPPEGLLLTDYLAAKLGLALGDRVWIEVMEGQRRTLSLPLAGTLEEPIGVGAYMDRRALNRLMGEGPALSGAWLITDPAEHARVLKRLRELPRIAGVGVIADAERQFRDYIGDTVLVMMGILLLMAGSITFAVVYSNARIAFAERTRELATLRVLGFTHGEVAWILIGEIALLILLAIPLGWLIGTGFALLLTESMSMDLFRMPFIISMRSYAFAAAGVLLAAVLSLLTIARGLRRLDLLAALKTLD
ncbi:MAG: ABC transporter permease [Sphingobacteriia bacterium]|nr:ABC transporter permease [Sphingobacteriia bacterium]NCC40536.1 ABC transporter permease [Gammaproteobacteria bacterium]